MPPPALRPRQSVASQSREAKAFLSLLRSLELSPPVKTLADLRDGRALAQVLGQVDPDAFSQRKLPPRAASSAASTSTDWVGNFNYLKRLYSLLAKYAADALPQPQPPWTTPGMQAIAKSGDEAEILAFLRVVVAVSVQASPGNEIVISRIQALEQAEQQALMVALAPNLPSVTTAASLTPPRSAQSPPPHGGDVESSYLSTEHARLQEEKATLERAYNVLMEDHGSLKSQLDEVIAEKDAAEREAIDLRVGGNADAGLKAEVERLKDELQRSEDNLGETELALDRQTQTLESLTRRVEELNAAASEVTKLKDQLDEHRHAADRLQKSENANKKLSKKLEESADLRRQLKSLEEENASLVDKNAALEEEAKKSASLKPLTDSYKAQIADLEVRDRTKTRENTELQFQLETVRKELATAESDLLTNREEVQLNQERVRELELATPRPRLKTADSTGSALTVDEDDAGGVEGSMGGELDDAMKGTTKTDLKLQIRRLQRELEAAMNNKADGSRVLVLENLLDDAKRTKDRYEQDYLGAHKKNLVLQAELDQIRSGASLGDGPEANLALRMRLNETVEELDGVKKSLAELEVAHASIKKELTIAKSDLTLVNKDQIDILHSLRESVNEDKSHLEGEAAKLKEKVASLSEKNRMQLDQINSLLMEKVDLQGKGIDHREKMIERERAFGDVRVSLAGRDLPEDVKARILDLQDERTSLERELKETLQAKKDLEALMTRAKKFIREQDGVIKENQKKLAAGLTGNFAEAQKSYESQIKVLQEDIARLKLNLKEQERRYRAEYHALFSACQDMSSKLSRGGGGGGIGIGGVKEPVSWLAQQRKNLNAGLRR